MFLLFLLLCIIFLYIFLFYIQFFFFFFLRHIMSVCHLGLLTVQIFPDGGQQAAETLQTLLLLLLHQFDDAVVHDVHRQHLQLEQLPNELDVA